ncbi:MAG: VacB/RNase II family 3'-5' exoribonuclease [Candidatus Eisenbacteria bacterium]|nr:VacB/RNase II family 3'-5' exoribonuclease [Candidatus Eisenbacteria bacterium]
MPLGAWEDACMRRSATVTGVVRGTRQGFAFLTPDAGAEDLFIAQENLHGAIHADRVEATLTRRSPHDFRSEAVVERILERTRPLMTGNPVRLARSWFVVPDQPVLPPRIRLLAGAQRIVEGTKILFRLAEGAPGGTLAARFEGVLGDAEDPALDAVVVATAFGLRTRFPDAAIDEALAVSRRDDPEEMARRCAYRGRFVLTIDPETAKDFDDAVSIQRSAAGYHLQVHIADVSWFVEEGGEIDREAALRGTSVYFPGGVIPMLPEVLSNETASLAPGCDRRVLTAEIDLDGEGAPSSVRLREGLIRSEARLHYEQAQSILDDGMDDSEPSRSLSIMADLAAKLRRRRLAEGGFDLSIPETEVELDGGGMPVALRRHRTLETNRIIEEFMILTNRAVARFVADRLMPLLFRVHEEPDRRALEQFGEIALTLYPGASGRDVETVPALRKFLMGLPEDPMRRILHGFFLRSLKQAVYSPTDTGHFGLGIDRYCHFTSPIRRYPDLFNHRLVRWLLKNELPGRVGATRVAGWRDRAEALATACSRTERTAERAEREIVRLKVLRWAAARLGKEFRGRVVGMVTSGLFVELDEFPVEGFVPRATLHAGARLVEDRLAFVEKRSRWELRLGDGVCVQVARVDLRGRQIDFRLLPDRPGSGRRGAGGAAAGSMGAQVGRAGKSGVRKKEPGRDGRRSRRSVAGKSKRTVRRPRRGGGGRR